MSNILLEKGLGELTSRLPAGWRAVIEGNLPSPADAGFDGVIRITAPDGRSMCIAVEAKARVEPRDALLVASQATRLKTKELLLISSFLSKPTRERLSEFGISWLDLTGNVRLVLSKPGLYIETDGAQRSPERAPRSARTLKGDSAGRIVRALLRSTPPIGVRDLASQANVDPGYVSRVLDLLNSAAVIERTPRGPVASVDRVRLLRRWAEEAPIQTRGESLFYLEPRGIPALLERLRSTTMRYAITGSVAAGQLSPIAAPRLAQVYVAEEPSTAAASLGLRPAETGGNVQLIRPRDETLIAESRRGPEGLNYASPVQVAADLMTAPGRGPSEGEELLRWMTEVQDAWKR
jgi:hypothetical protein